jgi:hypothetical protein
MTISRTDANTTAPEPRPGRRRTRVPLPDVVVADVIVASQASGSPGFRLRSLDSCTIDLTSRRTARHRPDRVIPKHSPRGQGDAGASLHLAGAQGEACAADSEAGPIGHVAGPTVVREQRVTCSPLMGDALACASLVDGTVDLCRGLGQAPSRKGPLPCRVRQPIRPRAVWVLGRTPSVVSGALKMRFRHFAVWDFLASMPRSSSRLRT